MAAKRTRKPVTGVYKVRRSSKLADAPVDHFANWNVAVQNALANLNWPAGDHHGAVLQLSATIHSVNPGNIIEYCATFT